MSIPQGERDYKAKQLALLKFQGVTDTKACKALDLTFPTLRGLKSSDAYKEELETIYKECREEAKRHCVGQAREVAKMAMDVLKAKLLEGDLRASELALKLVVKIDEVEEQGPAQNNIIIQLPGGIQAPSERDVPATIVTEDN